MTARRMILGTSEHVHDPTTALILDYGSTKLLKELQETSRPVFEKYYVMNYQNLKNRNCRQRRVPKKSLRSVLSNFEDLKYGIDPFPKHEMDILGFFNFQD